MRTRLAVLALAVVVAVLVAPSAAAYSGAITRAHANDTWTRGSIAGYVDWTDCGSDPCSWLPIATVQPVLPAYGCRGDEALDSDPNTRNVWNGGGRTANGTATFDLADVPILSGVHGQRLCLSVIETVQVRDPVCVAQAPELGQDPNTCPFIDRIVDHVVAAALLTVPPPPPPPPPQQPAPPGAPPGAPPAGPPSNPIVLSHAEARRATANALSKRFGRRWRRGRAKFVRCVRLTSTKGQCRVAWRFGERRYKGRVGVTETTAGIRARVRVRSSG